MTFKQQERIEYLEKQVEKLTIERDVLKSASPLQPLLCRVVVELIKHIDSDRLSEVFNGKDEQSK